MNEILKMAFRLEKFLTYIIFAFIVKFEVNQLEFWITLFMFSLILDKLENSIRREYNDTTKDKIERLIKEEEEKYDNFD